MKKEVFQQIVSLIKQRKATDALAMINIARRRNEISDATGGMHNGIILEIGGSNFAPELKNATQAYQRFSNLQPNANGPRIYQARTLMKMEEENYPRAHLELVRANANDDITQSQHGVDSTLTRGFAYDAKHRLRTVTGTNANQSFTLDLTDNRTNTTWTTIAGAAQTTPASIDPGSNRLTADGMSYTHDAAGNRTSQTLGSSATTYTIDAFNRITQATKNAATTYESPETGPQSLPAGTFNYQINALDERIKKTAQGTTTDFVWASPGQLLAEKSGTQWSDHIWLNGELVALVRNGQTYAVISDHLGRPEAISNSSNAIVWKTASGAFTRRVTQDSIGGYHIGFPGQYYDAELATWSNGLRDYDARNGRYLQVDPIGLAAGINLFAYVGGNSVGLADHLGLCSCNMPNSSSFWNAYPNYNDYQGAQVWDIIGGSLAANYGPDSNSCAARVSHGLNESGKSIPARAPGANRNWGGKNDGTRYIISARQMRIYLRGTNGAPDRHLTNATHVQSLQRSLKPGQVAIVASQGHAAVVRPGYSDPYVSSYLGDAWILPVGACSC